ncbi:glucosamine 6-phosphate N-acetyltransferase [Atractiella rhizophila]|nr:glucosamine 6-phosphate N-acetyltransferase [Atractiella rhizophila]
MPPENSLDLLFDASLIPSAVQERLGEHFQIRPLASTDYSRGHFSILRQLTSAPDPSSPSQYVEQFNLMKNATPKTYYTVVIVELATDQIVGVGTIFVERKFLRNFGKVGHIEDIAVSDKIRGKGLGKRVIEALTGIGEKVGVYKCILDCNKDNIGFYEKCGYTHKEYEMVRYTGSDSSRL